MSDPFVEYAAVYDAIYADKPYEDEAVWVFDRLASRCDTPPVSLLDLGCGTGTHAMAFAKLGLETHGVDASARMLSLAEQRRDRLFPDVSHCAGFSEGDIRTVRLGRQFDLVVSLFHVMSYQTSDSDLVAAVETASAHLAPGGLFAFDAWHGPAVVADPPEVRIRRFSVHGQDAVRLTEPAHEPRSNRVDIAFTIFVRDRDADTWQCFREVHAMRYLFRGEVESLLDAAGFDLVEFSRWMRGGEAGAADFSVFAVAKKR